METSYQQRSSIVACVVAALAVLSATAIGCDGYLHVSEEVKNDHASGDSTSAHPGNPNRSTPSATKTPTENETDAASESICDALNPGSAPMHRLTEGQYNNTVDDLFSHVDPPEQTFPADGKVGRFTANVSESVSARLATQYRTAAETVAEKAVEDVDALTGCREIDTGCVDEFIRTFGKRAYRRPLTDDQHGRLLSLFESASAEYGDKVGVRLVLEAMLQSPNFLYRVEEGEATEGGVVELTDYELATRLSYLLWNSAPDDQLLTVAEEGRLSDPAELERQARRMLEDERARETMRDVAMQWMGIDHLERLTVPDDAFDEEMRESMRQSTVAFLDDVLWKGSGSLRDLLTSRNAFVDREIASVFGVEPPDSAGMVKKDMSGTERIGMLTQPAMLASHAEGAPSVYRGKFIQEALLCNAPPPPPDQLDDPPETHPGQHPREIARDRMEHDQCGVCHKPMEGLGTTFNQFDAMGRHRLEDDHGNQLDDTGRMYAFNGEDTKIDGVPALAHRLADSDRVKQCVSEQMFHYAFSQMTTSDDECTVETLQTALERSNYNLKEVLVAITQTDAFRYKEGG